MFMFYFTDTDDPFIRMAQQQVFGIAALSCYTVDSSDESDGDQDQAEVVMGFFRIEQSS